MRRHFKVAAWLVLISNIIDCHRKFNAEVMLAGDTIPAVNESEYWQASQHVLFYGDALRGLLRRD